MNIAVCDDERKYVDSIVRKIKNYRGKDNITIHVDEFTSAEEFLERNYVVKYDLIYMDIELKDGNGLDVAAIVHSLKPSAMIILMSEYLEYVNSSFVIQAFQFLKKQFTD